MGRQRLVVIIAHAFHLLVGQLIAIDSRLVPPQGLRDITEWSWAQTKEHNRLVGWQEVVDPLQPEPGKTLEVLEPMRFSPTEDGPG